MAATASQFAQGQSHNESKRNNQTPISHSKEHICILDFCCSVLWHCCGVTFTVCYGSTLSVAIPIRHKHTFSVFQVVEPFMQSGMLWETWQHGPGALPQCCPSPAQQPFSFTVAAVAVPDAAGWYVNRDHSKWGVTSHHAPACCRSQVLILHPCLRPSMCVACGL